ncbi:MAG: formate dehydrogenase accessory sulfurtransferase FdhD [Anaerolineae bacterium]|nr:formate dehydrogenase accessory sulfurtransferase FdhD [Anaerolineae bacterium]
MSDEAHAGIPGATPNQHLLADAEGVHAVARAIPTEAMVTVFVNGVELVNLMCTPVDQEALALGFLRNEGLIGRREDVRALYVCKAGGCVDVWLAYDISDRPRRQVITSGCVGGVTFDDLARARPPLQSDLTATPAQLQRLMHALYAAAALHNQSGGVHTSALCRGEALLLVAEDVGRHNTLDKLHGMALAAGIDPRDCILITTGRVSSEMLGKAHNMGAPVVASRTSPTSLSVTMAEAWNITLVGYVRRDRLTVYTHPWRLGVGAEGAVDGQAQRFSLPLEEGE